MQKQTTSSFKYIALALVATTLWGSAFPTAKLAFDWVPPITLSAIRFVLAGVLLVPVVALMKVDWRKDLRQWRFILLFALVQTFLQYGLFYMGLNLVPSAIASIIIGAGPLFVAILAHFTMVDDRLDARKIIAVVLGVAGVVFISLSGEKIAGVAGAKFYYGVALLITSNICASYTNIMVVKHKATISPIMLTLVANFSGGVMLLIAALAVERPEIDFSVLPTSFYLTILWLAIIPAAAFSVWYYLLSLPSVKVSELNIWKFTIPIIGVALSWLMLPDEYPSIWIVIGIVIISAAVLILQLRRKS